MIGRLRELPKEPLDRAALLRLAHLDVVSATAASTHKPVVLDETWLYKGASLSQGVVVAARIGTFSFFAPLDVRFLKAIVAYADSHNFAYVSPFWSSQFFAYLAWTPAFDAASYQLVREQATQIQAQAIEHGRVSATGLAYAGLIR
jgi:hypothetical protein